MIMGRRCWLFTLAAATASWAIYSNAPNLHEVLEEELSGSSYFAEVHAIEHVETRLKGPTTTTAIAPQPTAAPSAAPALPPATLSGIHKDIDFTHNIDLPKPSQPVDLKVPTPVFVLSLPKSGTTTMYRYFECGLGAWGAAHHWFVNKTKGKDRLGVCMGSNIEAGRPLLQSCQDYSVYTDAGAIWGTKNDQHCYYPSVHGLEHIAENYPSATIVLVRRNATEWVTSASRWHRLLDRISAACEGFPSPGSTLDDWTRYYVEHNDRVRDFATRQPGWRYLEYQLESPETGAQLEANVGIPASCWGHCLPNHKCYEQVTGGSNASNTAVR